MSALIFSENPLHAGDRRDMEVEAGHIVNALSKGDASPTAADAMITRLDRLRFILAAGRYPVKQTKGEIATETVQ